MVGYSGTPDRTIIWAPVLIKSMDFWHLVNFSQCQKLFWNLWRRGVRDNELLLKIFVVVVVIESFLLPYTEYHLSKSPTWFRHPRFNSVLSLPGVAQTPQVEGSAPHCPPFKRQLWLQCRGCLHVCWDDHAFWGSHTPFARDNLPAGVTELRRVLCLLSPLYHRGYERETAKRTRSRGQGRTSVSFVGQPGRSPNPAAQRFSWTLH